MASQIDSSKPADGVPAVKADLRANLQAAKTEIETLQSGKADAGHGHVLAEITDAGALAGRDSIAGADLDDGAVSGAKLTPDALDGRAIDMQDALLSQPTLKDFAEVSPDVAVAGGALTLDLATGSVFEVVLDQDVATLTLTNPPPAGRAGALTLIVRQDASGGRTLAWPGAVKWAGGSAPALSAAADAVDIYTLITRDGGATWFGFVAGQAFA